MVDLVDTEEEVIRNIDTFTTLNAKKKFKIDKLMNPMHFVAHKTNKNYRFAPSEFVGCKSNPYLELDSEKIPPSLKKDIYAALTNLLGQPLVYKRGNPDNKKIYDAYQDCCVQMGTRPNISKAPRYFWLIDSDVPRAHSIQPTTHSPQQATPKHCCKILKAYTLIQRLVRQLVRR